MTETGQAKRVQEDFKVMRFEEPFIEHEYLESLKNNWEGGLSFTRDSIASHIDKVTVDVKQEPNWKTCLDTEDFKYYLKPGGSVISK